MPVGFCFIKADKENETLAVIDDKIAEYFGKVPDPNYAPFMDMVSDFGVGILMRMGGSEVNKDLFDKWLIDVQLKEPDRFQGIIAAEEGKLVTCLRKFLYEDYTFRAWR